MGLAFPIMPAIGGLGPTELIIILIIVVVLFGASRIPSLMRSLGRGAVEFKQGMQDAKKIGAEEKDEKPVEGAEKKELPEGAGEKHDQAFASGRGAAGDPGRGFLGRAACRGLL